MDMLVAGIHWISPDIRTVSVCRDGSLTSTAKAEGRKANCSRPGGRARRIGGKLRPARAAERGPVDWGGARYLLARYGDHFVYLAPIRDGYVSVAIDAEANLLPLAAAIEATLAPETVAPRPGRRP